MPPPRDELGKQIGQFVSQQLRGSVVDQVRKKFVAWQDPRAKLLRRRKRAVRSLSFRSGLAAVSGAVAIFIGTDPAVLEWTEIGSGSVAVLAAAAAVSAGVKTVKLHRTPLPEVAAPPPELPPATSQAREPMQRLAAAEESLAELLNQLSGPQGSQAPLTVDALSTTRATADEAAAALRAVAARLRAIELARDASPAVERGSLSAEVRRLRDELDEGVDGYGRLVASAGRALAASTAASPREALQDATDHLAGLAAALRELARRR